MKSKRHAASPSLAAHRPLPNPIHENQAAHIATHHGIPMAQARRVLAASQMVGKSRYGGMKGDPPAPGMGPVAPEADPDNDND